VSYVSGASLAIPSDLARKLGGFDEHYCPAYGEDSDLAFRVRVAGRRVLYQPSPSSSTSRA
jgi:GT2 family glycosyltransferase